jgi:hypothetical protein
VGAPVVGVGAEIAVGAVVVVPNEMPGIGTGGIGRTGTGSIGGAMFGGGDIGC